MPCKTDAARADLVRLASFSKWPMDATMMQVSLVRLAAAGFLYTGDSDGVMCSYCDEVVAAGWERVTVRTSNTAALPITPLRATFAHRRQPIQITRKPSVAVGRRYPEQKPCRGRVTSQLAVRRRRQTAITACPPSDGWKATRFGGQSHASLRRRPVDAASTTSHTQLSVTSEIQRRLT